MEKRYDFEEVTLLSAFAVGVPGKRTFFLTVGQKDKWVRVWLEKYLLESLALAIDQFLLSLSQEHLEIEQGTEETSSTGVPSGLPSAELETDQVALGFDRGRAMLGFLAHGMGLRAEERAELHCWITHSQLEKLGRQAKEICAAGRPRCVLCGGPIEPTGHICPKIN